MRALAKHLLSLVRVTAILGPILVATPAVFSSESDLSTTVTGPAEVRLGQIIPITVGYANAGPDAAESAYVNVYIPSGVPARLDELTQEQRDAILASSEGTDSLGNRVLVFDDENFCEHLILQLQRSDDDDDDNPIGGLEPGVDATFSFDLEIPMEAPKFGRLTITEPAYLAQMWRPALTEQDRLEAAGRNRYARGGCDKLVGGDDESTCDYFDDNCFGTRIALMEPIETEFELVNDGTTDPTHGCHVLTGFTPGRIAVIRRGSCDFSDKAFSAEQAGAVAAVIVNDGRCFNAPDTDDCVLEMIDSWSLNEIPVAMLSTADGEEIIAALEADTTVRGIIGPQDDDLLIDSVAFLADEGDIDPNPDNDQGQAEIEVVSEVLTPPVASFTYSPELPTLGSPIQFTDTSTQGPPTSWAWDFGDGIGMSTEQNPTYTYTVSGAYTVSLTVTNSVGADTAERTFTLCCGGPLSNKYFVPAAAHAAGAEGAFFQTDLDVNNAGSATARFAFEWLPRGTDNTSPLTSDTFTLGPGKSARYTNLVAEIFGLEPNAVGAVSILSDSPFLIGLSRTYNLGDDDGGTFGQALPAIPVVDMIPAGERRRVIFMTEDDDFRSNLGCLNATSESLRVMIELFDDEGSSLETLHLDLPPLSPNQLNRVFADYAPVRGTIDVWSTKPDAAFTCYGSLLDNGTNDPTTVMPQ